MKQQHSLAHPPVLVLVGPTAIGKTALSLEIAEKYNCEIVSVDSMQVYRYMDIGTAKASPLERSIVPHHLIDIIDPDEPYDAACFVRDACAAIARIHNKKKIPLLTGGTGLYLKALIDGLFTAMPIDAEIRASLKKRAASEGISTLHRELSQVDPEAARRIHCNDEQRILRALEIFLSSGIPWTRHLDMQETGKGCCGNSWRILQIGLTCDRNILYDRINYRCKKMLDEGLGQEVISLLERGFSKNINALKAIGYRHIIQFIEGAWTIDETFEFLSRDTRRYAKRQYTWFNKIQDISWYESSDHYRIFEQINKWLG